MKQKIIVLGSSGMAGHVIASQLRMHPEKFEVITVSRTLDQTNATVIMDISNFSLLKELIVKEKPDVIINCVGILNKTAEENPDIAVLMNSYLPHFLEAATAKTPSRVIHISTDCVFSGSKGGYAETDVKDGAGFYAQTKALGEIVNTKDLTIRTSIIGPELKADGIGLLHWFLHQQGELKGYTGAFWSGVTTIQLGKSVLDVLANPELTGLVHLTNNEKIHKFDLISLFKEVFERESVSIVPYDNYKVDKSLLNTRTDFKPNVPGYAQMIVEMKEWMQSHQSYYAY
ncbi:MAG: SDR family oxidoreductase [Bacteroidota bacterium]